MRRTVTLLTTTFLATAPAFAETRDLDAHVHGTGELNISIDGNQIAMELHAPGADIVGFEYIAESDEDRAAIENGLATLAKPSDLFIVPAAAECTVTQASAELEIEGEDHDDHGHEDHADHDDHEEHADEDHADHEEHDHEEHAEHDDHDHEEHAEHDDHDDHAEEASHSEFHAEYLMTCADVTKVTEIEFAYFDVFENALELEVQVVSADGAQAFEVEHDAPTLDMRNLF